MARDSAVLFVMAPNLASAPAADPLSVPETACERITRDARLPGLYGLSWPPMAPDDPLKEIGHPRGTLAIVFVFGLLFALSWFAAYLAFVGRGAPHH